MTNKPKPTTRAQTSKYPFTRIALEVDERGVGNLVTRRDGKIVKPHQASAKSKPARAKTSKRFVLRVNMTLDRAVTRSFVRALTQFRLEGWTIGSDDPGVLKARVTNADID